MPSINTLLKPPNRCVKRAGVEPGAPPIFSVGDFVLVAKSGQAGKVSKLFVYMDKPLEDYEYFQATRVSGSEHRGRENIDIASSANEVLL